MKGKHRANDVSKRVAKIFKEEGLGMLGITVEIIPQVHGFF